jgi:predicted ATPase/class 3 adenylate cyclase
MEIPGGSMILPGGTITFLLTDIEGSTRLWEEHPEAMRQALARHDALLRQAIEQNSGVVFKTVGDAFCAAFATAPDALAAAIAAQCALAAEPWQQRLALRVRMALHTGTAELRDNDYFGPSLNRVARLLAIGSGGQVLLSEIASGLAGSALPEGASLKDLGRHRLKDLEQPEQVFQLLHPDLPADFPPVRSLDALRHNLPVQITSFIGREQEMTAIKQLLSTTHLLTLTGSGGCGKSRLALQAAAELVDAYPDGVWLVELAPLADSAFVPQAAASALGVREEAGRPVTRTLQEALKRRRLLLVLDNCEHLLSACAQLAASLLSSCPGVKILATSREWMGIAGEMTYRIPSLSLPDPANLPPVDTLLRFPALQLFHDRAQFHLPAFALTAANAPLVAQVCHRLDGIPLAIELAAARVRSLPVEQIAARLDDRFRLLTGGDRTALPRQQTLRALMDWSYDLLNAQEKLLLHRLSVFAGGWTLETAEQVCGGEGIEAWEVLDVLTGLVDKSMVAYEALAQARRYRLLETVRQYASDKLRAPGDEARIRSRHLDCFLRLAEQIEPELHGPEQLRWLDFLEQEHDNLRTALDWSQAQDEEREKGLRLAGILGWFWKLHNHLGEGRSRLESMLAGPPSDSTPARAAAVETAGLLAFYQNDYVSTRALLEQSSAYWRERGDRRALATSLAYLGAALFRLGEPEKAVSVVEESLALAREVGDPWRLARSLWTQGTHMHFGGNDAEARPIFEESIALFRRIGDPWGLASALYYLGEIEQAAGHYASARALIEEALGLTRPTEDRFTLSVYVDTLGEIALAEGDYRQARCLFEESLALCREDHNTRRIAYELRNLGHLARFEGRFVEARAHYQESLTLYGEMDARPGIANLLDSLARLAGVEGQAKRAARLFGATEALRQPIQAPVPGHERLDYESRVAAAREALGAEAFAAAWEEGRAMTLEQAIAYALEAAGV